MQYHHRQFGTFIVAALAAAIIFSSLPLLRSEPLNTVQLPVILVLLAAIALFYALTIEIREDTLYICMGIGLIRKKVLLSDITQARKVRIPIYAGWGIHGIPGLYRVWNVSGRDGVELDLKRGGRLIVGSDEPDALVQAIESSKTD